MTTPRGFSREPGFAAIAPLSESEGTEVADAMPEADDLVHSAVLFVDGLDARELQAPPRAAPARRAWR